MSRILIAEDNQEVLKFIKKSLRKAHHKIDVVNKAHDAWNAMNNAEDYDVLLINIMMPSIDGFVMAQKALHANPGIQIIFITGFAAVAMDTYNTPTYAPRPLTSRPFHLTDIAARIRFYMGEGELPFTHFLNQNDPLAQDNVIYAQFDGQQRSNG